MAGFDVLVEIASSTGDKLVEIAAALYTDSQVNLPYMGEVYRFPKSFFLVHAVEHGVEHRTEIKVALGALGVATPALDGWAFAAACGYGKPVD